MRTDIKDHTFGPEFFAKFTLVLNALDNLAARRHVNRICLAAGVPLIESGTAGYLGQVSVHVKGVTECYECQPKPPAKTYATCTIRNNPTSPIHCIVWAKFLFGRLFGKRDDQNAVTELEEDEATVAQQQHDHGMRPYSHTLRCFLRTRSHSHTHMSHWRYENRTDTYMHIAIIT